MLGIKYTKEKDWRGFTRTVGAEPNSRLYSIYFWTVIISRALLCALIHTIFVCAKHVALKLKNRYNNGNE